MMKRALSLGFMVATGSPQQLICNQNFRTSAHISDHTHRRTSQGIQEEIAQNDYVVAVYGGTLSTIAIDA